ncbi:hypothetical protein [Mucilaginibacter ginsenosidivorans]|uniref:Outer membrane beta-barrel protein n=1 Tax=Mucilaginibacter ginsenosidivorans TaxID=398053 RepID=A0A5B8UVH4_9SPHI|nr:hypothetical protein [Mucilaginibacter ginsenosidivorans]QEC62909.1 hypothetical protein FRZ54_10075 [Mucilaginibacter ginsenosidivorans]
MKSTLGAIIIALICPLTLLAQSNYKPGYVVNIQGDTLKGFINYREWTRNPEQVSFKSSLADEESKEFNITNAKAFAVDSFEYYERHNVKVSMDSLDINAVNPGVNKDTLAKTVFLRIISKGTHIALYRYTDKLKRRFYISETNKLLEPEELAFHAHFDRQELTAMVYIRRYRTQLLYIAQKYRPDDLKLRRTISNADYNEDELKNLVSRINGSSDPRYTKQGSSGTRWFAGVSANHYSLKYTGAIPLADASASGRVTPKLDGGIDFLPFKAVQRFYIRVELAIDYHQYDYHHREPYSTPTGATIDLHVKQFNTSLTPQVIYNLYNAAQLKVFLDMGIAITNSNYGHYRLISSYDSGAFPSNVQEKYPEFNFLWMTFPLKAGVAIGRQFELYAGYVPKAPISDGKYTRFQGNLTSYSAGINFYIGKK